MASTGPATVDFQLPAYKAHIKQIETVNLVYNGIDTAVKAITQLPNEYTDSYNTRLEEATLDNYVERIVTTMAGMIMRKPLVYDGVPTATEESMENISGQENLDQFTKQCIEYAIRDGKSYILVDAPMNGGNPYFTHVTRASLINWRKDDEGNFTFAVIYEVYQESDGGEFGIEESYQYRVIKEDGTVEIWRQVKNQWSIYETINTSYDFCPLYELDIADVPPLYDIARINIKQMNCTSIKDRFVKESIDPVLFLKAMGLSDDDESESELVIGVNQTLASENPDAEVKWIELDGKNYEVAQSDILYLNKSMEQRALQLQDESIKTKTATEVSSDNEEGSSRLSDIAEDTEITINTAVNAWSMIKSSKELAGQIIVNRDFNVTAQSNVVSELNTAVVSGNLSKRTFLESISKSEIVTIENIDDELAQIEEDQQGMELIQPEPEVEEETTVEEE